MSVLLFEELGCLDTDTIVECMTVESVLQTCHNSLENYTATTGEVLNIWLERLLPAYILRSENCREILKCLYKWFQFHLVSKQTKEFKLFSNLNLITYRNPLWRKSLMLPMTSSQNPSKNYGTLYCGHKKIQ